MALHAWWELHYFGKSTLLIYIFSDCLQILDKILLKGRVLIKPITKPKKPFPLGMVSHKISLITIFGHKHFRRNFLHKFDIFQEKNYNSLWFWFIFGIKFQIWSKITSKLGDNFWRKWQLWPKNAISSIMNFFIFTLAPERPLIPAQVWPLLWKISVPILTWLLELWRLMKRTKTRSDQTQICTIK